MSLANEAANTVNITAVTTVDNIKISRIIETPRVRSRQRVANGEIRCWRIAQRLDALDKPNMRVRLHVQLEVTFRRGEAITRRAG